MSPSAVPIGWSLLRLGDAGSWAGGGTPSKAEPSFWTDGTVPWVSPKDMKVVRIADSEDHITPAAIERSATKLIPAGSVLMVTRSGILEHTFPVAVTDVAVTVNQDLKALTPAGDLLPDYLAWCLRGCGQDVLDRCSKDGTTVASIEQSALLDYRVPVAPVGEQVRIVEALDSYFSRLDDAVATLERAQAKLKAYRASVLKAAVEGRLVPTEAELARAEKRDYEPADVLLKRILAERRCRWEEAELAKLKASGKTPKDDRWKAKYKEPVAPDTSGLPELPDGWCWTSLGQAFTVTVGATPSRSNKSYWDGDIPWVSSGEVAFCRIVDTKEKITREGLENSSTKINPKGSVLVGMIGEGKTRGQPAILDIDACGNQNAAAIWVSQTDIVPEFVYHYMVGEYDRTRRRGSGNNQPALNKSRVEAIPLPLPPVAEQTRMVEEIEQAMSVIAATEQSVALDLKRLTRLRQAILKWAFEGKLVDQDPNDEPAEKLLERIRAEREAAAPTKKKPGRKPKRVPA